MSLTEAVEQGVAQGLRNGAPKMVELVLDSLWRHPWYPFIAGAQCRLIEVGMKPKEAWELARKVLVDHVKSEELTFGDPDYDWGPQGGREIIEECEIEHWESCND